MRTDSLPVRRRFGSAATFVALTVAIGVASSAPLSASDLRQTAIVKAVQQASPAVVNIHGQKTVPATTVSSSSGATEGVKRVNGMGTGVVIDERGYVLTNYHVIDGVSRIQCTLADGRDLTAQLVANDPVTDLAVIRLILDESLPVMNVGTSSDLMLGEPVIAIGHAYGYPHTVTRGIISALHRTVQVSDDQKYEDLIQTDAAINPGNSGGPLINIDGELIGINVAVRVGAQGIGFAIPVDKALAVAAQLLSVERIDRRWHGLEGETRYVNEEKQFVVTNLKEDSPAAKSGLVAGDVLLAVGNRKIERALDVERALIHRQATEELPLTVLRREKPVKLALALEPSPRRQGVPTDRAWELLGLKLETIPADEFRKANTRYRGGLRVTAVKSEGPAALQGIRVGDTLVGMHIWETISLENVSYIVTRPDLADIQPLKFFILRGDETLYGHFKISSAPGATRK